MINIKNVSFKYGEESAGALKGISLKIKEGECVLLCGESGCGKTTLTRLINGLIPNYYEGELRGEVYIDDLCINEAELYETAHKVGSVFQNPRSQFFCVDTTSEIAFGCENMGLPAEEVKKRITSTVDELHMQGLMNRNIFNLSGGEKQKVACACVSAMKPEVYVLDEPTSNLDVDAIESLKETLKLWKSQGKTIVIAEHRLYWLKDICDRVIYMKDGNIVNDTCMEKFSHLDVQMINNMGLRTLNMDTIQYVKQKHLKQNTDSRIELKNFCYCYKDASQEALNIPSLEIPMNGVIAVVGHNGAGKSTFSKCMCGLQKKFKGTCRLDGITYRKKNMLKRSYLVMQDVNHQLFCETVKDEVALGMKEENEKAVNEILRQSDLQEYKDRHPMSLSGGQKQRVAIASAVLAEKEIIFFDEPTSGLDYKHMEQTSKLIESLVGLKTIFVVTHDPELIMHCCNYVLHLEHGKVQDFYDLNECGQEKIRSFFRIA